MPAARFRNPKRFIFKLLCFGCAVLSIYLLANACGYFSHRPSYYRIGFERERWLQKNDLNVRCGNVIRIVVVACGKEVAMETLTMIKSALLFTKRIVEFHVFTSDLKFILEKHISSWPNHIQNKMKLHIRDVIYPLSRKDKDEMKDWWGPCASFRLFLPDVMAATDSVLYVDTDVTFLGPVDKIWDEFCHFNSIQVGGLAQRVGWDFKVPKTNPNFIEMKNGHMTQVNSGVFLMNLTRMRTPVFKTDPVLSFSKLPWNDAMLLPLYRKHIADMHGDQNLINTIFHYNPEKLYFIPCSYNYHHKFCIDTHEDRQCREAEINGAAVIHGNANTYQNNFAPAFRAIHQAMTEYQFETDLRKYLYVKMKLNLQNPKVEQSQHCGNKTNLFLKNIQRYV